MLLDFICKNYKSFENQEILSLEATEQESLKYHVCQNGEEKILPVAVIYGDNGCGKSNLLNAFACMREYVVNSYNYGENKEYRDTFRNSVTDTEFEVYFMFPNDPKIYNYGFCIGKGVQDQLNFEPNGISEEWLNVKNQGEYAYTRIFYRHGYDFDNKKFDIDINLNDGVWQNKLIISVSDHYDIDIGKKVVNWFKNNVVVNSHNLEEIAQKYLSFSQIDNMRQVYDYSDSVITKSTLYAFAGNVLRTGNVLFVDNLTDSLHHLNTRQLIQWFTDPYENKNGGQLILTTNDLQLMNELRFDEIYFIEKDRYGVSDLYSLSDFKDEKGKEKKVINDYLVGRFGAIPNCDIIQI